MPPRNDDSRAQSLQAKAAEVRFRRDLCRHRVGGETLFPDEFDGDKMAAIFRQRMAQTVSDLESLPEFPILLSCLEVGAECAQRAAAVQNAFPWECYACDISLDSLCALNDYASRIGVTKLPARVCCDLEVLPFATGSFDLVFAYQTLHHFVDPRPAIAEIRRATGRVFVGAEEPCKRRLRLGLGKKRLSMYHPEEVAKSGLRKFVEEMVWDRRCNEVEYGVIENERLSLRDWKRALEGRFECEWFWGHSIRISERLTFAPSQALRWFSTAFLTGATISWVGRVEEAARPDRPVLICPDCLHQKNQEVPLRQLAVSLQCGACERIYPIVRGIPILLRAEVRERLYPAIAGTGVGA